MSTVSTGRHKLVSENFKTNTEDKIHLSMDEDNDLYFQREIGSSLWILNLEANKKDHRPTRDLHRPWAPGHLRGVVAK